jgi:hypothetical protein
MPGGGGRVMFKYIKSILRRQKYCGGRYPEGTGWAYLIRIENDVAIGSKGPK